MPRESVFTRETPLWHRAEGWRTFPPGESNPGPAWSEIEGGEVAEGKRDAATLKELADLAARAEKAEARVVSLVHDLSARAQETSDAKALVDGLQDRALGAERNAEQSEADKLRIASERDQAREVETGLRNEIAALKAAGGDLTDATATIERLVGELSEANQRTADKEGRVQELETDLANANAKLAAFDGDGDGAPGGSRAKAKA
jgi:chromosome segregation ATPase